VSGAIQKLKTVTKLSNGIKIDRSGWAWEVIYAEEVKKFVM
jgi:hypothetical protein